MLDVRLMKQTFNQCGPFCLKMVFDYYGQDINVKEISRVANTSLEDGTTPLNMVKAAKHFGFSAEYKDKMSLSELRSLVVKHKIPVIVDWFDGDDGHYSVVIGLDNNYIYLADPDGGDHKKMTLKTFMRIWFDFTGSYMKSSSDLRLRPVIVIRPKK